MKGSTGQGFIRHGRKGYLVLRDLWQKQSKLSPIRKPNITAPPYDWEPQRTRWLAT
jgi:hypothetical protein